MQNRHAAALTHATPFACVVVSVLCFQFGAALAKPLFPVVGAQGASALRLGLAALMLNAIMRPWRTPLGPRQRWWTLGYGLALAGLNLFFYLAIQTLPLGPAVAIEFLGPLTLAILGSRRAVDALWAGLAGAGVLCLLPIRGFGAPLDPAGLGFVSLSAVSWMIYIVCGQKAGQAGGSGASAALGVTVAALAVLPFGIRHAGFDLLRADVLPLAAVIALVSGCLPYALEMAAMKRMPTRVFGILMSLEPAFGALFGYLILDQHLTAAQGFAIAAIMTASAGTSLTSEPMPLPQ